MLWNIGSIYVIVLLTIMVAGLGVGAFRLLETTGEVLMNGNNGKKVTGGKNGKNGGGKVEKNSLLSYAGIAIVGLIVSYFALGLTSVTSEQSHDHAAHVAQQGSQQTQSQVNGLVNTRVSQQATPPENSQGQYLNNQLNEMDLELGAMERGLNSQGY